MKKEPHLLKAVDVLRARFSDAMMVVDHWEADLTAVGIARKGDVGRLAYLSCRSGVDGDRFYVALEAPPVAGIDAPYVDAGEHDNLSLAAVADLVARHLGLP